MTHTESSLKLLLNVAQRMQLSCTSSVNLDSILSDTLASVRQRPYAIAQNGKSGLIQQLAATSKAANELRDACIASGRVDLVEAGRISDTWGSVHEEQFQAWAEDALSRARVAAEQRRSSATPPPEKLRKPVFNHEYTPLLDKYFQYNAYPSAPDRAVLARKSMMTPRQIEVWFQNHRNRARKDNKPLRRLSEEPPLAMLSLEPLRQEMPFFATPKREHATAEKLHPTSNLLDRKQQSIFLSCSSAGSDVLNPPRPSHAFPSVYSPSHNCDFLETRSHKFPVPVWDRKPVARSHKPDLVINMQEFILDFSQKLHLRTPTLTKDSSTSSRSWFSSRVVVPLPAPLPSLLPLPMRSVKPSSLYISSVPACTFRTDNLISGYATLEPCSTSNEAAAHRKVARLPKRTPKSRIAQRRTRSEDSGEPPSRTSSRSSQRRLSSSSSSGSSSPPSTLTTPVIPNSSLPSHTMPSPTVAVFGDDAENECLFSNNRTNQLPCDTFLEGPTKPSILPVLCSLRY